MIPFIREFDAHYGAAQRISPRVQRVLANNPGRFTGPGTGTLVIGIEDVVVIDPGPDRADHLRALEQAIASRPVRAVVVTHNHMDHSALSRRLADRHAAPLCGRIGGVAENDGGDLRQGAGDDESFTPDVDLIDGWRLAGAGWTLEAIHTPGHAAEHFCFALPEERTLFCGDHVMAWSTSIVTPPSGHMGSYIASLRRIRVLGFDRLVPTHGAHIDGPDAFLAAYIGHRLQRRDQIVDRLGRGARTILDLVDQLYLDLSPALRPAAGMSVWAHLIELVEAGQVSVAPPGGLGGRYSLAK